jgi:hypothetical protein
MSVSTHNARRPGRRTNDSGHVVNVRNAATPEQLANVNEIIAEETARETGKPLPQRPAYKPETIEDAIARLKAMGTDKLKEKLEKAPPLPEETAPPEPKYVGTARESSPAGAAEIRIAPPPPKGRTIEVLQALTTLATSVAALGDRIAKLEKPAKGKAVAPASPRWATTAQVSAHIGVPIATLETWRSLCPERLPFVRVGACVRYDLNAVDRVLATAKGKWRKR